MQLTRPLDVAVTLDGASAVAVMEVDGAVGSLRITEKGLGGSVRTNPEDAPLRVRVLIDAFRYATDDAPNRNPPRLGVDQDLEAFFTFVVGESLEADGLESLTGDEPILDSSRAVLAAYHRDAPTVRQIEQYVAAKIYWAYEFGLSPVGFGAADARRLNVNVDQILEVATAGDGDLWIAVDSTPARFRHTPRLGAMAIETFAQTDGPGDGEAASAIRRVFLSHAAADRPIAERIAEEIKGMLPDADVFVASRPGHIGTGEEWWPRIQHELREADAFLVLLTPSSITRPWINFECGAAWMAQRELLTVSAAGLDRAKVPEPLKYFQITSLEESHEAAEAFRPWGLDVVEPEALAEDLKRIAAELHEAPNDGWEGLTHGGRYFAWDGPNLHSLDDRNAEPTPPGLEDALRDAGYEPSYGSPDRLGGAFAKGRRRVFETDRQTWRRIVVGAGGEQVLLVHTS